MKHRRSKAAGLGAVATLFALTLTACVPGQSAEEPIEGGGVGTEAEPVEIRMIANEAFANQWQDQMVPEFNKKFPHVKVTIDGVPYTELLAKSMLDATSDDPTYDVIVSDDNWIPQLADVGAVLDLKEEATEWTADDYDWDDFNAAPLAAGEWDGHQYGVPLRSNLLMMYTNKSLYEDAGLEAPTSDITWDEYLDQLPDLVRDTDDDGKPDVFGVDTYFAREPLTPTIWQTILNSNGGQLLTEDGEVAFDNEQGVEALQTHVDLLESAPPGAVSHTYQEPLESFRQGKVASMFTWGSVYKATAVDQDTTTLKPDEVGLQVMPVGSEGPGAHRGIWNGSVASRSEHPEAAWTLLQWLSSTEGEIWQSTELGVFPARKSTLATTPSEEWLVPVFEALQEGFDAAEAGQMWRPRLTNSDAVQQILADETSRATAGEITAEEAIENAAAKVEDELG